MAGQLAFRKRYRLAVGIWLLQMAGIANPDNNPDNNPDKVSGFALLGGLSRSFRQKSRQNGGIG
jgi:hypothetical protein